MYAPHLKAGDRLTLLMQTNANLPPQPLSETDQLGIFWDAEHYQLSKSSVFNSLTTQQQSLLLQKLSQQSIALAYYIEKFGLNYGAKMIAEAESVEEKSLYTLFSADETRHRLLIEKFLIASVPEKIDFHPLLPALAQCLQQGSKDALIFTIQVLLEGFGIYHYNQLRESTHSNALKAAFGLILKDEAGHHGMGVVLTERMPNRPETQEQILELTHMFIESLLQANWVTTAMDETVGGFTESQRNNFQTEIQFNEQLIARKNKIKNLLHKAGGPGFIEVLHNKKIL
jgi:rubrerythrin